MLWLARIFEAKRELDPEIADFLRDAVLDVEFANRRKEDRFIAWPDPIYWSFTNAICLTWDGASDPFELPPLAVESEFEGGRSVRNGTRHPQIITVSLSTSPDKDTITFDDAHEALPGKHGFFGLILFGHHRNGVPLEELNLVAGTLNASLHDLDNLGAKDVFARILSADGRHISIVEAEKLLRPAHPLDFLKSERDWSKGLPTVLLDPKDASIAMENLQKELSPAFGPSSIMLDACSPDFVGEARMFMRYDPYMVWVNNAAAAEARHLAGLSLSTCLLLSGIDIDQARAICEMSGAELVDARSAPEAALTPAR